MKGRLTFHNRWNRGIPDEFMFTLFSFWYEGWPQDKWEFSLTILNFNFHYINPAMRKEQDWDEFIYALIPPTRYKLVKVTDIDDEGVTYD